MDHTQFDRLARSLGTAASRRTAVHGVAASLLAAVGLGAVLDDTDAQRRRRRRRRRCGAQYAGCNERRDCCHGLICKTLRNPSVEQDFTGTCAYKRGCGRKNDFCERNRDCCTRNFRCQGKRCRRRNNN